jgi:hypothetical protein
MRNLTHFLMNGILVSWLDAHTEIAHDDKETSQDLAPIYAQ